MCELKAAGTMLEESLAYLPKICYFLMRVPHCVATDMLVPTDALMELLGLRLEPWKGSL